MEPKNTLKELATEYLEYATEFNPLLPIILSSRRPGRPSYKAIEIKKMKPLYTGIGRNEKCPCESGKKFKKCCIDKKVEA